MPGAPVNPFKMHADELRACVLEVGKVPVATRYADRLFRLSQRIAGVADLLEGKGEIVPPEEPKEGTRAEAQIRGRADRREGPRDPRRAPLPALTISVLLDSKKFHVKPPLYDGE
jgi:hypothetical protein